jgi:glutathione S-transferase
VSLIYHIATKSDWESAQRAGEYTTSSLGVTLAEEGFIHCSQAGQVAGVAKKYYQNELDLVLLVIDAGKLTSPLRYEAVPGEPAPYPHIYGPLNPDAVVEVRPFTA